MIKITVGKWDSRRAARIRAALGAEKTSDVLRLIPLFDFQDKALAYIRLLTPRSSKSAMRSALGLPKVPIAQRSLADTWKSKISYTGNRVLFQIYSSLETIGGKRGEAKLMSIEYGNRRTFYRAKRTFRFLSDDQGWVTIAKGRKVNRPARKGKRLMEKTSNYIERTLLPQIQGTIERTVKYRLETLLK